MNFASRYPTAALICAATILAPSVHYGQEAPKSADYVALDRGEEAIGQQKYDDAIKIFEDLIKMYPQSPAIPQAYFRIGYANFLKGEYDLAVTNFRKVPEARGAAPEVIELATSLIPQALSTKASKQPEGPTRTAGFEDAVKHFDEFLGKFPQSEEVETANYGKALAYFNLSKYDGAAAALRTNLQKFPTSETVQDTQLLLALVLGADAVSTLSKTPNDAASFGKLDEGEKVLRDIVAKRANVGTMNDAQFQLGETLSAKAGYIDEQKKDEKAKVYDSALEAYRGVITKEQVIQAQRARLELAKQRRIQAGIAKDQKLFARMGRLIDKEQGKLVEFENRADQTISAKIKSGEIFFQLSRYDEARVLLSFVEPFATEADEKKQAAYFITMSYALQNLMDKAVERYDAFTGAYKGAEIAQNLPLIMAVGFVNQKEPQLEKAIEYCKQGLEIYPTGRFAAEMLSVQASALIGLRKFEEAESLLKKFVAGNPPKELAAEADFNLATIYRNTDKNADALKAFKDIREKYPATIQAEQAAYWVGELSLGVDAKEAVNEFKAFIAKYPESQMVPQANLMLGRALKATNQPDEALAVLQALAEKYPTSAPAPFSYFERARIESERQKFEECLNIMKDFIAKFPDDERLFQAYDLMGQITALKDKVAATAVYQEFVSKRPSEPAAADALLKVSNLWKEHALSQGPVLAQDATKRAEWTKGLENSMAAAQQILEKFPESPALALGLNNILEAQKARVRAKVITDADVETYFKGLSEKAESKPEAQSKVQFALAGYMAEKDKSKGVKLMAEAYKPELKYAPEDLDLYGTALINEKNYDQAIAVYEKLAKDYPNPPGSDVKKAPQQIMSAQATSLAGLGKALQGKGDKTAGGAKFKQLEELYPWSPKMAEVNYGVAVALREEKKDDDAMKRLLEVVKLPKAPAVLRAHSMLLIGKIHEDAKRFDQAIDNYIKIASFYAGVPDAAAEGLWRGAQLLERQAKGEIPRPTPPPKTATEAKK